MAQEEPTMAMVQRVRDFVAYSLPDTPSPFSAGGMAKFLAEYDRLRKHAANLQHRVLSAQNALMPASAPVPDQWDYLTPERLAEVEAFAHFVHESGKWPSEVGWNIAPQTVLQLCGEVRHLRARLAESEQRT